MAGRGWDRLDFIIISGDAYVDHPSFGSAVIGRVLEAEGYRVGIIPQPDWQNTGSVKVLGKPRLAWLIAPGVIDSMVNHYTANRKPRRDDGYSPGDRAGKRPDRAAIVYTSLVKSAYKTEPSVPVILGGVEASLRRFAHYDYWSDKVRRSILTDSKADMIVYGMGEPAIIRIAASLDASGVLPEDVPGTVIKSKSPPPDAHRMLPSYARVKSDKKAYADHFAIQQANSTALNSLPLAEPQDNGWYVIQNPPAAPMKSGELDHVYELPYTREAHPMYAEQGGVPALEEVQFSLVSSRGCFGGCTFCAIGFLQGRTVTGRSHESIIREAENLVRRKDFKGYIHDLGGPTANFRHASCKVQESRGVCRDRQCLHPEPCTQLIVDHRDYTALLRKVRKIPGIKKLFIRSGLRFDYILADQNGKDFLREVCTHHVSGRLKVAPEHISEPVLHAMGKPAGHSYAEFRRLFMETNDQLGKKQYLIPYFISAHPGSGLKEAVELAEHLRDTGYIPDQVQDFYPTPGTAASCMYHTGLDPRTMKPVYVSKGGRERRLQRALLQYNKRENYHLVLEALKKAGREDLIGNGPAHLVAPPGKPVGGGTTSAQRRRRGKRSPRR